MGLLPVWMFRISSTAFLRLCTNGKSHHKNHNQPVYKKLQHIKRLSDPHIKVSSYKLVRYVCFKQFIIIIKIFDQLKKNVMTYDVTYLEMSF